MTIEQQFARIRSGRLGWVTTLNGVWWAFTPGILRTSGGAR